MAHLIQVGNSLGVRIPKAIIAQVGFKENTNLEFQVTDKGLLISPIRTCREGWAQAFNLQIEEAQEENLLSGVHNRFDEEEWEW